jgi:hypothetical protein
MASRAGPNSHTNLSQFKREDRPETCFRYRNMTNGSDNRESMLFVQNACQYYATARFAMHAGCMPVMGILFHHTVEMLLKGGLASGSSPTWKP